MSTMYKFASFLDGNIEINSNKNFGTKVTITMPIESKEKKSTLIDDSRDNREKQSRSNISVIGNEKAFSSTYVHNVTEGGFRVIVIDNNQQHLSQMEELLSPQFLRRNDVEVTFCSSSSEAIRHVEETKFDLLLIDYHMPNIDGLQFLKFINGNDNKCKHTAKFIIAADASIPESDKKEMLLYCNKILSKGLTSNDVRALIRSASLKAVS